MLNRSAVLTTNSNFIKKLLHPAVIIGLCLSVAISIALLGGHTSGATNGLVAAYGFSEGSGTTVADLSGNGNTGTIRGATWTTAGKYGNALSFNASSKSNWVTINDSASLHLTNGMTLEAWVRPTVLGTGNTNWRTALVKEQTAQLSYALYANTDTGKPSGHAYTTADMDTRGNSQIPLSTWTHLSVTYDGSNLRFYTNGVLQTTRAVTGNMVSANKPLRIGGNNVWDEWFGGQIDEVRVYNRALTATELQTDMNTALTSGPDTTAPTTPTNLATGTITQTSIGLNWTASTDNVGVTGYGLYNGALPAGSVTVTNGSITGLTCGTSYTLGVDAYDAATNRSSKATIVAQTAPCNDTTAPSVPTNLAAGTATATTIPISWTASTDNFAVTGYTIYKDGVSVGTVSGTSSTVSSLVCGTSYALSVDAYDAASNHSAQTTAITASTAACDTTAPAVSISAPADGATVAGTVAITADSNDDVAVAGVQFKLDGNNLGAEDTSSPYGISWNTVGVSNGTHVLTAVSRDTSSNTTTSSSVNVTINNDVTAPTVSLSAPVTGATVSSNSVTVSATATDDVAVAGVQFKLDGNNLQTEVTTAPYQITWNSTSVSNGSHTLTAVARDAAGNTTTATNVTVTVTNAGPTTPTPVPGTGTNGITVAGGFVEASARQVIRTSNNVVYVITADDNPCQNGTKGVIRVSKGIGAQSGNANVPTSFTEMDTANRPASTGSGSCQFGSGSVLFSPDSRLDRNGIIHMAYIDTATGGNVYYQTFSTITDTYGARTVIATGAETAAGSGWPRGGQLSLTLDANDIPHVVYTTNGTSNTVRYTNKIGGSWSTPVTLYTGTDEMHPSMVTSLDGTLHLTWLHSSLANQSTILYAHYVAGVWSSVETVSSGDANVLNNTNDDQGPSVATDSANRPHVLYMDGTPNGATDYVRMRYRTTAGAWVDNTPPGTNGGASNSAGNWYAHTPQNYISSTNDDFVFLGHDNLISPGVFEYQTGGPGNNWSSAKQMEPRNQNNTTAGAAGVDGSASVRFDPLRDNNTGIIDVIYYDENDGTAGYLHHATVYYKAVVINSNGGGGGSSDTTAPTVSLTAPTNGSTVSGSSVSLSATASDNVGVAGVQFKVDGNNVGAEDTTSPYQINWDSTGVANGTHTITAVARDAAGNTTTSTSVSVTTNNTATSQALVGSQTIQATGDSNVAGRAEAFQFTASTSGVLSTIKVYVDTGSTAPLVAGIYTDNGGHPGTLVGQGTLSSPVAGAWNTVTVSGGGGITSGGTYWIAVLGPSGTLKFRDTLGGGHSEASSQSTLTTLPTTWTSGQSFTDSALSAYGSS